MRQKGTTTHSSAIYSPVLITNSLTSTLTSTHTGSLATTPGAAWAQHAYTVMSSAGVEQTIPTRCAQCDQPASQTQSEGKGEGRAKSGAKSLTACAVCGLVYYCSEECKVGRHVASRHVVSRRVASRRVVSPLHTPHQHQTPHTAHHTPHHSIRHS
jgi:hypothetical protein